MGHPDYQRLLEFGDQWLQLGLLTEAELHALGQEYETSEDKNTEHYRYRVFCEYLVSRRPLLAHMAEALYELGREDPDRLMGEAMMRAVVGLPECPEPVLDKASASGVQHLIKAVRQTRLLAELNRGLTADLFALCLASQDGDVHRELLARPELSRKQVEQLAEAGANRAVRNMATARLRFKHDAPD